MCYGFSESLDLFREVCLVFVIKEFIFEYRCSKEYDYFYVMLVLAFIVWE